MAENREEILANFQSITAMDDVAEAIFHLEANDWDLLSAVNNVLGNNEQSSSSAAVDLHPQNIQTPIQSFEFPQAMDVEASTGDALAAFEASGFDVAAPGPSVTRNRNGEIGGASSSSKTEEIQFNVHFNGRLYRIVMNKNLTIGELKMKVQEKTSIQMCRQALKGWKQEVQKEAQMNNTVLSSLNLGRVEDLFLTDMSTEGFVGDSNGVQALQANLRDNQTFTLKITMKATGEEKVLKFPGRHTIIGVQTDLYTVTDIPVRHQKWTGWPTGVQNSMTLAESGIELEHNFTLERAVDSRKEHNSK